jgi:stage III sporulation protein SpoIIIAA
MKQVDIQTKSRVRNVKQITTTDGSTQVKREYMCNDVSRYRMRQIQFRTRRAGQVMAGLRRVPGVCNNDEGRTVRIRTLRNVSCVIKGPEVRGDGGTMS